LGFLQNMCAGQEICSDDTFKKGTTSMGVTIVSPDRTKLLLPDPPWASYHRGGSCLHTTPQLCLKEVDKMSSTTTAIPRSHDGSCSRNTFHVPPICRNGDYLPPCERVNQGTPALTLRLLWWSVAATAGGGNNLEEIGGLLLVDRWGTSKVTPHEEAREEVGGGGGGPVSFNIGGRISLP
jgi:hypothetical protein